MEKIILINTVTIPDVKLMVIVKTEEMRFVRKFVELINSLSQFVEKTVLAGGKSSKKVLIFEYSVLI